VVVLSHRDILERLRGVEVPGEEQDVYNGVDRHPETLELGGVFHFLMARRLYARDTRSIEYLWLLIGCLVFGVCMLDARGKLGQRSRICFEVNVRRSCQ
jgi:hypothetical protein